MQVCTAIVLACLAGVATGITCPGTWQKFGLNDDLCFKSYNVTMAWIRAHEYCKERGATLLKIKDAFDARAAKDAMTGNGKPTCNHWLGLYADGEGPQKFVWDDDAKTHLGPYTNWQPGEPVVPADPEFAAVFMNFDDPSGSEKGLWRTARNEGLVRTYCFACLRHAEEGTTTTTVSPKKTTPFPWMFPRKDCQDIFNNYHFKDSGTYVVEGGETVYCDMHTLGGAWTTLMRRVDGTGNFHNRALEEYKTFFGDPAKSHWQSLDFMAKLTKDSHYDLLIEAKGSRSMPGSNYYAYDLYEKHFAITEGPKYTIFMFFGHTSGNMTSSRDFYDMADQTDFRLHNGDGFSHGGWWLDTGKYKDTDKVAYYLNGDYALRGSKGMYVCQQVSDTDCVIVSPEEVSMKIRRKAQYA